MAIKRVDIPITMSAASAATAYSAAILSGYIYAVGMTSGLSTAAGVTITAGRGASAEEVGHDILAVALNSSLGGMFYPRVNANTTASGSFDPAGNTSGRLGLAIPVAEERVKVVVASGGATATFTVRLYVDGIVSG